MKYNNQMITKRYSRDFEEKNAVINNFMLRKTWSGGRPVNSICTDRTEEEKA